ncbi:MAG: metallophosphoesterase family protein [Candidatus Alcyoniella australis]|nr:metallophosphoesterase family protein [Candidatus Alcyoniella australis]
MRVGVISDTHLTSGSDRRSLDRIFAGPLFGVDLVLHAGDLIDLEVFEPYARDCELLMVAGNMDSAYTRSRLPQTRMIELEGRRIGLAHGWGAPEGIEQRLLGLFDEPPELLVHGHTHCARIERIGDVTFFNPGSATDPRFTPRPSVGIIEINGGIKPRVIEL